MREFSSSVGSSEWTGEEEDGGRRVDETGSEDESWSEVVQGVGSVEGLS
jgi:hypothetical protein